MKDPSRFLSRHLLLICDYHPALLESLLLTMSSIGVTDRFILRKRGASQWRDVNGRVLNLPLRLFSEEGSLTLASVVSLVAYLVVVVIVGILVTLKEKTDSILGVFAFPQGLAAVAIGKITRCRVDIMTDGGDVDIIMQNGFIRPIILAGLRGANNVTALNQSKARRLRSLGIDAGLCPTIGIDTSRFEYVPIEHKERARILYVGRLSREKRPQVVLEACRVLRDRGVGFELILVGDGPLRDQIVETVVRGEMNNVVSIAGYVPHTKIHQLYRSTGIFVLPSKREGVSVALLEAMSSGCLCVVTDIPDNREIILDMHNGITFRLDNHMDLADKILWGLQQPSSRIAKMTENARVMVERNYSLATVGVTLKNTLS